ncbi:PucR family transcriptional regulator [Thermus scotoductus]|uniref:PucR family transcriptional regulator n=1 Tax=Thermus scotoductus TaxID=37636 RepID=A0A430S483_THESC|nr:helix-turn-helix domain-containing protein [Thermus scotoductus]RTG91615.1 PucR family transcriptional regulator [Thermus scotoductus]RTH20878.1 PucR family transcriptional regulator [Thermus scotoductus]RTH28697.1 PucR family transcriptional regulator [Thermus scotoductus]RTI00505.1 PucR family transcriptional regulator [Thermus scotoductus]RTI02695.1 PucR family transcriptional regulator [Thermus scotoductus]
MPMPEFSQTSITFLHLVQDLGLEVLVPSYRPVLYLLEGAKPLLPLEGALLLTRPEGNLWRYRTASGFLLPAPDPELLEYARKEGLGVAVYPPWLKREELAKAVALRLFHLGSGLGMAGLLDLLLRLPERPFLEVLYQATGLALARVAPWEEVLGFAGPVPPQHPKEPGEGRGWLSLEAGEGVLVAYGEEEGLRQARGLLEVAARLLRVRALERSLERMREESLGGALLEGLILGEAEPDRLFAFGFTEGVEWVLALVEPKAVPGRHRLAEEQRREATLELRRRAGTFLDRLGVPYLLTTRGNRLVAMWQVHNPKKEAQDLLSALPPGSRLGYSAVHAAGDEVQNAYREALIALKAARAGEALSFSGLDPVAFVLLQQSPEDLKALVERYLPLPPKLLKTLEVYMATGSVEEAASSLHIHPNTLRYRLKRIEAALGSLSRPEVLAQVHLALKAQDLLMG